MQRIAHRNGLSLMNRSANASNHAAPFFAVLLFSGALVQAADIVDYRDALDRALLPVSDEQVDLRQNSFDPFVGYNFAYDSNLFRLPVYVTDLRTLPGIGSDPSRSDEVNSVLGGVSAQWLPGNRQSIVLDLRADENRYVHNTDLNNLSSNDSLVWNWALGGVLSGQVGADYIRASAGFTNTGVYSLAIVSVSQGYAGARYQVGPHWGLFAGILGSKTNLSDAQPAYNDFHTQVVDLGADYALSASGNVGFDYRYTDARYPNAVDLSNQSFAPDYKEDRARLLLNYAISDKTLLNGYAGYIRRTYPSTAIGNYSGEIWRVAFQWQTTDKTLLIARTWQALDADYTAETDYYRDRGFSLQPQWTATEKLTLSLIALRTTHDYFGSNPLVIEFQERKDTVTSAIANLVYTPTTAITVTLSGGHEKRESNSNRFDYSDDRGDASVIFKF